MRIGIFTNNYLPMLGGVPHSIEHLRRGLEHHGHQAFIFAPHVPQFQDASPRVFRAPSVPAVTYPDFFVPLPFWPGLASKVQALSLDLFHAHHPFLLGRAARRLASRFGRPLIFTHHTRYDKYVHYIPLLPQLAARKAIQWSTAFSNQADLVIAPSRGIARTLVEHGVRSRIEVVPTGVDLQLFTPGDRANARRQLGLPLDGLLLLHVGRLDREKSIEFILRAFQLAGSKHLDAHLVLVGQGKEAHRLRTAASHLSVSARILFVGPAAPERVAQYCQASDLFVFASETETQGLAVSEAHAAGLPVVAVRAPGVEEVVRSGESGLLLPPDLHEFASALELLLLTPSLRAQMGLRARQIAEEEYSAERSVARHLDLYSEVLRTSRYLT